MIIVPTKNIKRKRFHFFGLHLRLRRLSSAYDLIKTKSSESEAEAEG